MVQGIAAIGANPQLRTQMPPDAAAALGQGFGRLTPEEINELRKLSDHLKDFSPDKLKVFEQIVTFLKQNSAKYDQAVQLLVSKKVLEPGDLPPTYIPAFFEILDTMIRQAMTGGPKKFAKGGIAQLRAKAADVAKAGTGGDKVLAHINPREAAMLQATRGGGTNPATGLPEYGFFDDIGNFLKQASGVILPVALTMMGVPAVLAGAVGSGVGAMINGANPGQALQAAALGGLGGAAFSGISSALSGGSFSEGLSNAFKPGPGVLGQAMGYQPTETSALAPATAAQTPGASTPPGTSTPINSAISNGGGTGTQFNAGPTAPAAAGAAGAKTGFLQQAGDWIKTNPLPAAGIAGLGGAALGYAMAPQPSNVTPVTLSSGPTAEQVAAARFPTGSFAVKTAGPVTPVPTSSPAYPNFRSPFTQANMPLQAATGGQIDARIGGHLHGPGTGTSDSIPAKLSDGEFVMTAKAVRGAGDGDRNAGAKKMYQLMHQFEKRA